MFYTGIWQGPDPTCPGQPAESSQSPVGTSKGVPLPVLAVHQDRQASVLHCFGARAPTENAISWRRHGCKGHVIS